MIQLKDNFNRIHNYLRISLTDKCNFNCIYCNPEQSQYPSHNKNDVLTYEEILRLIKIFSKTFGFSKYRFTGGEPLVRKGVFDFFTSLLELKNEFGFSTGLTTNASLLKGNAKKIFNSGIDRLNISLDSLDRNNFLKLTNRNQLQITLDAIDEALDTGFTNLKVNCVVIKGINDNELIDFVKYAVSKKVNIRFIEFMPFGNNAWESDGYISFAEMKKRIEEKFILRPVYNPDSSITKDFSVDDGEAIVSFITPISEHFCDSCNRLRISSEGNLKLCLFSDSSNELDLQKMLRSGYNDQEIANSLDSFIKFKWEKHPAAEDLKNMSGNNMLKIGG